MLFTNTNWDIFTYQFSRTWHVAGVKPKNFHINQNGIHYIVISISRPSTTSQCLNLIGWLSWSYNILQERCTLYIAKLRCNTKAGSATYLLLDDKLHYNAFSNGLYKTLSYQLVFIHNTNEMSNQGHTSLDCIL